MFYADLTQQGFHLFRHHDRAFDVRHRLVSFGCRIGGPDQGSGEGFDQFGLLQGVRPNWGNEETHGDVTNWLMWQIDTKHQSDPGVDKRPIPGWAQVWASLSTAAGGPGLDTDGPGSLLGSQNFSDATDPVNAPPPKFGGNFFGQITVDRGDGQGPQALGTGGALQTTERPNAPSQIPQTISSNPVPQTIASNAPGTRDKDADKLQVQPVAKQDWLNDVRFEVKKTALPPFVDGVPKGIGGATVAGTYEYNQEDLFLPSMPNVLIAPHEHGSAKYASTVYDLLGDKGHENEPDPVRKAKLHTLMRVWQVPLDSVLQGICGPSGSHALAIQAGPARGGISGRAAFADVGDGGQPFPAELLGIGSWTAGGPFHPGTAADKHGFATNEDGDTVNSLHLATNAYFYRDGLFDAPLEFGGFYEPATSGGTPWRTFLLYDQTAFHSHPKGMKPGLWRFETYFPMYYSGGPPVPPDGPPPPTQATKPGESIFTLPDQWGQDTDPTTDTDPNADHTTGATGEESTTDPVKDATVTDPNRDGTYTTNPAGDVTATDPNRDSHRTTDPIQDAPPGGFTWTPENPDADSGAFTNTPANPDADQVGPIRLPSHPPAVRSFQPVYLPPRPTQRVAQPRPPAINAALKTLATLNEIAAPGVVLRPQMRNPAAVDFRNAAWNASDTQAVDATTPAVARLEAVGNETPDGAWSYFEKPGAGRYGGSAQGGLWFLRPDTGAEQIYDNRAPTTSLTTTFGFYNTQLGFGSPTTSGLPSSGYALRLDTVANQLKVDTLDSGGNVTATGTLWPSSAVSSPWTDTGTQVQLVAGSATHCVVIQSACISSSPQTNSETFGSGASASSTGSTALGKNAQTGTNGVAIGYGANGTGGSATAVGQNSVANASGACAFGNGASATAADGIAIGDPTTNGGIGSIVIGGGSAAITSAQSAITIGYASGAGTSSVTVGDSAICAEGVGKHFNVAIGASSHAYTTDGVAIGYLATCADNSVSIGSHASGASNRLQATCVGALSFANDNSCAYGYNSFAGAGTIALGRDSDSSWASQTLSAGSPNYPITLVCFGKGGNAQAAPLGVTIKNTPASGTDTAGASVSVQGGLGTSKGAGGHVVLQTGIPADTSGTALQSANDRVFVCAKPKAMSANNTLTTLCLISTGSNSASGCTVIYTARASDGTDWQTDSSRFSVTWVNKAGTLTVNAAAIQAGEESKAVSSGTIAVASGVTTSGTNVAIQLSINSSLTTTIEDVTYTILMNGPGTVTPQ